VSLRFLDIPFVHEPLSVFSQFSEFSQINPIVKAPTLVTDDGAVLIDSTLILDFLERRAMPKRRLIPVEPQKYIRTQRFVGLALAACEKTVQLVYERNRPSERQYQPWIERVQRQMTAAYRLLEADLKCDGKWLIGDRPTQADISVAIAWRFNQFVLHGDVPAEAHSKLVGFSERAEALTEFFSSPID
jgi:glutathione S-transferase